ncbi:DNA segregation ATPase FtsK/SpoIIIE, S-DNA-T family [Lentibacillus persicus]|uniref:DNA segregation ATPase FtsK/SpoIIIE, S-DNA-T family n=1 Tax=Lentibacillus persicus TaxID=640948 RepID=A0A1I1TT62_9BACI|nr:DNA translocase FtsK [Lentibacillus persicus]SFD61709.1 DNA segregation ATPase FtsK/SpoIIIE, S-DNA-T family [Lentibacillus persicus]
MWGRWKEKLSRFFFEEKEEEEDVKHAEKPVNGNQNIHTRITYQYPAERPFRFPVIPDKPRQKESTDIPAYQRKTVKENNQPNPVYPRDVNHTDNQESQGIRKIEIPDSKEPFKPSDVPSPVYGFQKKESPIEDIPAYKRKQDHNEALSAEKEIAATEEKAEADTTFTKNDETPTASAAPENPVPSNNAPAKQNASEAAERPTPEHARARKSRPNRQKQEKKDKSGSVTPPFNVLMSANDKRNYAQRKKSFREQTGGRDKPSKTEVQKKNPFPYHLLNDPEEKTEQDKLWMQNQKQLLEKTLKHFNVRATVVNVTQGPSVTRFEVQPEPGVKVSKIKNLSDDLKLSLAAKDIRIEAPIPGKHTIGIEIPNKHPQTVSLQEIFEKDTFQSSTSPLTIGLGLSIEGDPLVTNIQKMPHGLIAGATGSGKSVCINTILLSLLYKADYEEVKFMLIDPKMVELAPYNGIPHLISPVITDVKAATAALKWAVKEMEKRYDSFVQEGVRDIERFNQNMTKQGRTEDKMPFIVIVIDELADLMMVAPQDVEDSISRIAQKARACGIHLLLATQRPSVDVITGLIKANIPTRIAFSVSSQVDSKTIIDTGGAEKLLGKGDMLFIENGAGKSIRLQGAFVSDEEIERVTEYARSQAEPDYAFEQEQLLQDVTKEEESDELLEDAIDFVIEQNSASTSLIQRHFKIGYNRAARLMDAMENMGVIGTQNGSKPRDVLISSGQLDN